MRTQALEMCQSGHPIPIGCDWQGNGVTGTRVASLKGSGKLRGKVFRARVLHGSRYPCKTDAQGLTLAGVIGNLGQVAFRNFSARRHGHG
jgi:hypothetical protein